MSVSPLTSEPARLVQGDSVSWTKAVADYLPADGWTLHYAFVLSGEAAIVVDGSDNGDGSHLIEISAVTSAGFAVGTWRWQAYVTQGAPVTERTTLYWGNLAVDPDFATQTTGYDGRSTARKMLDLIEALILGKLSRGDVTAYSISTGTGSRSLSTMSMSEWRIERSKLQIEVAREEQAERIAKGLGSGRRLLIRHQP